MGVTTYETLEGEILGETRSGVERDYIPDPLGSVAALIDSSQTKTDAFTYWPYGEERNRTGTTSTPFRFVGTYGYYRDDSGRTYVRARHLRTSYARWLTVDPLWPSESAYGYVRGTVVVRIDPSGAAASDIACMQCIHGVCDGITDPKERWACFGRAMNGPCHGLCFPGPTPEPTSCAACVLNACHDKINDPKAFAQCVIMAPDGVCKSACGSPLGGSGCVSIYIIQNCMGSCKSNPTSDACQKCVRDAYDACGVTPPRCLQPISACFIVKGGTCCFSYDPLSGAYKFDCTIRF